MNELRTLLKREESYAVHALLDIAAHPGTSAADIATRLKFPPAFTAKVMRRLVTAGFVTSQVGRSGGLSLAVDLAEVSLLDAIEGVSGTVVLDTCQTRTRCATQERTGHCSLKLAWLSSSMKIREVLAGVALSELAAGPERPGAAGER